MSENKVVAKSNMANYEVSSVVSPFEGFFRLHSDGVHTAVLCRKDTEHLYSALGQILGKHIKAAVQPERDPAKLLSAAAATFAERNAMYGDNYKSFGQVLLACFGGAIPAINTVEDVNRLSIIIQLVGKLTRYCVNFEEGGHQDSAHDGIVYNAILEALTK